MMSLVVLCVSNKAVQLLEWTIGLIRLKVRPGLRLRSTQNFLTATDHRSRGNMNGSRDSLFRVLEIVGGLHLFSALITQDNDSFS
jgi:hypothetical protein